MEHTDINTVTARHWHKLADDRIQCDVCPRLCKLHDDQRGLCFVRKRAGNQLVMTSYGRSSGFCVDPIEKKPLHHFYPGSAVLSFGTAGCNLSCKFCQNWDISKSREMDKLADQASPKQLAQAAKRFGCQSIAYTYNDPVIFLEYAVDVAEACHEHEIKNVAVTAGYISEQAREEFFTPMDAVNVDLKAFSERFYYKLCGAHLEPILETLVYLKTQTNVWLELTTLLIPEENDSEQELQALTQWIYTNLGPSVPLHFTAFHPDYKLLHRQTTPFATLTKARDIARRNGLHYVYTGNINDPEGGSTWCPNCQQLLIERDRYQLGQWHLNDHNQCQFCETPIEGVFKSQPEHWGRKRIPVTMS